MSQTMIQQTVKTSFTSRRGGKQLNGRNSQGRHCVMQMLTVGNHFFRLGGRVGGVDAFYSGMCQHLGRTGCPRSETTPCKALEVQSLGTKLADLVKLPTKSQNS